MVDDKDKLIVTKGNTSILAVISLVQLQKLSNTTYGLISDILIDAKAENNLT